MHNAGCALSYEDSWKRENTLSSYNRNMDFGIEEDRIYYSFKIVAWIVKQ